MRPVLQNEAAECGLACLAMVCEAHGQRHELAQLRARFPGSLKGMNLAQLRDQAAAVGLGTRALRVELEELPALAAPAILHWDLNHFVVLEKASAARAVVLDPAVGRRVLKTKEVSAHFTGVALELSPTVQFAATTAAPKLELAQLTGHVRGLAGSLGQILLVAAVLELFALFGPMFSQLVVDDVLTSGDRDLLTVLTAGFALLLVIQVAVGLARSWMIMVLNQTVSLQWTGNLFGHLIHLPLQYFERRHLGDVVSRFGSVGEIQRTLTTAVVESILDGLMALTALALMLLYSPALSLVTVTAVALYAAVRCAAYGPLRNAAAERLVLAAHENTHFLETLRAITPLKLFGREEQRRSRWQNLVVEVQNRDVRTARMGILFSTANSLILGLENLAVLALGARLVMAGQTGGGSPFTVGMLLAFMAYKAQFAGRLSALIGFLVDLKMLGLHAERLADIALTPREPVHAGPTASEAGLAGLRADLELRKVSFRYGPTEPWVLDGVDLRIAQGESVAITGASGCGKTTLLKIMLGLLEPTSGEVRYGGVPVQRLGLANVRRQIGTVMQDDVLLTGSLADNIAFFDPAPQPDKIEAAAKIAEIHADIVAMPMAYQTLVGDLGSGLSGGQRQRVLLARALYKSPRVLALDEATSHLDVANERAVGAAISSLRLTRIVIAHRPETIRGAQRVVALRAGRLVEVLRSVHAPVEEGTSPQAAPA